MRSRVALAGPKVATILALRRRRIGWLRPRASSVNRGGGENEDGAEIVDIGQGRTAHDEVAQSCEDAVAVILRKCLFYRDALRGGTGNRIRVDNRPGIVLGSVDAVGIAGERGDALTARNIVAERRGKAEQELGIAPTPAAAAHRYRGFPARQQHRRERHNVAADPEMPGRSCKAIAACTAATSRASP